MSLKWTGNQSETGILRKSECKEKKEELFVFGYSCKLFRDDVKALQIDQGKHLIPWMGDETLKIDRYDARGALHDLSALEAPPGGYDWRVELTRTELDVEQLCDEERYRALHTDEDEEEMYKEEELKRLHAAGYGQVGFNYDAPAESTPEVPVEFEEPFEPSQALKDLLPTNTVFPDSQKQNAIIEKTANFIAHQGTQMEILIKAKQRDNTQFKFLNKDSALYAYYTALTALVKAGKWPEKTVEVIEEKQHDINEEYLHPSLAATVIESAPSIPSIHYKPSADCDYTLLISRMRGEATLDEAYTTELAPGEVAPPGTEPLPPRASAEISRAPVMYNKIDQAIQPVVQQQYAALYQHHTHTQMPANTQTHTQASSTPPPQIDKKPTATKSTGLSLMKNYNTDSDSDVSDFDDSSSSDSKDNIVITPPEDVKTVIDKMAAYVARNGDEFEEIVRSKNDPRFTFLEPDNLYHPFYKRLMQEKRGVDVNGKDKDQPQRAKTPTVSFSIKKLKEPDPILPKPALPYESSSEDDETKTETSEEAKEPPKTNIPQITATNNIPPVLVYKMEAGQINNLPVVKTIEQRVSNKTARAITIPEIKEQVKEPIKDQPPKPEENIERLEEKKTEKSPEKIVEKIRDREKKSPSKRKHHDRKKEYRSKEHRERRIEKRSADREKERERKRDRESEKKSKKYKVEVESEIISLEDNSDEMIDLTGDQSDSKGECETEADKSKQQERRRRAAEFLKKVGVDPAAAALPTTSLASAMVDTLESLRKKKNEQEEKRRRHEKRRRKEKREYEGELDKHRKSKRKKNRSSDEEDSEYESSKMKKHRKDKKPSKNKKKRKREIELEEEDPPPQINIDLTNTLKELRTISPTKELGLQGIDDLPTLPQQESSSEEEVERKKKKKDREYSEGEWSRDSDEDSVSSTDKK